MDSFMCRVTTRMHQMNEPRKKKIEKIPHIFHQLLINYSINRPPMNESFFANFHSFNELKLIFLKKWESDLWIDSSK